MQDNFRRTEKIYHSWRTEVYRAIRESDGLSVILKIRNGLISSENRSELVHEFELGKTLESDYSGKYLALKQKEQTSILVMQDDNMNPLKSVIPEGGFDLPRFLILTLEITSAIEVLKVKVQHNIFGRWA